MVSSIQQMSSISLNDNNSNSNSALANTVHQLKVKLYLYEEQLKKEKTIEDPFDFFDGYEKPDHSKEIIEKIKLVRSEIKAQEKYLNTDYLKHKRVSDEWLRKNSSVSKSSIQMKKKDSSSSIYAQTNRSSVTPTFGGNNITPDPQYVHGILNGSGPGTINGYGIEINGESE